LEFKLQLAADTLKRELQQGRTAAARCRKLPSRRGKEYNGTHSDDSICRELLPKKGLVGFVERP
jgi:hypothetical protein